MQKVFLILLVLISLSACKQKETRNQNTALTFKMFLYPSFDEKAKIVLTKIDTGSVITFLLLTRFFPNKPTDTFYFKSISLTKEQFENFDSLVIQKVKMRQPKQWTGCCDGMPVEYFHIQGTDTTKLWFRSPDINSDSSGYQITKISIDYLAKLYKDSVITDYLQDIESYMDETKRHTKWDDNLPINRLRKIEYSR
jgi:hypothetical protein